MQLKKFDSINVVPFIDIMLVLLVIVLVSATFVAKGIIALELPRAQAKALMKEHKNLIISIRKNGEIYLDKKPIGIEDLEREMGAYDVAMPIHVYCDKEARFEFFVQVIDILKKNNYENLAIVTQKEQW